MLTYLSQVAILRFLPINLRKHVVHLVPILRGPESKQPYYLHKCEILNPSAKTITVSIDGYTWTGLCNNVAKVTLVITEWPKKDGTVGTKSYEMDARELIPRASFIGALVHEFLGRRGTIVKWVSQSGADEVARQFLELVFKPKIEVLVTGHLFLMNMEILARRHKHMYLGAPYDYDFEIVLRTINAQKRPVGSHLVVWHMKRQFAAVPLSKVLQRYPHLNLKRGVVKKVNYGQSTKFVRIEVEQATLIQCLVLEMEHADVVITRPDVFQHEKGLHYAQLFQVVPKRWVPLCEPRDWLTTYKMDGSVSYVDMS